MSVVGIGDTSVETGKRRVLQGRSPGFSNRLSWQGGNVCLRIEGTIHEYIRRKKTIRESALNEFAIRKSGVLDEIAVNELHPLKGTRVTTEKGKQALLEYASVASRELRVTFKEARISQLRMRKLSVGKIDTRKSFVVRKDNFFLEKMNAF
jgi:hypothetical protein